MSEAQQATSKQTSQATTAVAPSSSAPRTLKEVLTQALRPTGPVIYFYNWILPADDSITELPTPREYLENLSFVAVEAFASLHKDGFYQEEVVGPNPPNYGPKLARLSQETSEGTLNLSGKLLGELASEYADTEAMVEVETCSGHIQTYEGLAKNEVGECIKKYRSDMSDEETDKIRSLLSDAAYHIHTLKYNVDRLLEETATVPGRSMFGATISSWGTAPVHPEASEQEGQDEPSTQAETEE